MIILRRKHLLLPLLALSLTLPMAASVYGQSATLQVNFGTTPRWTNVHGTRVQVIPVEERMDYDMFRYGGSYYVYNNNRWYMSRQDRGQFVMVDDRSIPNDLTMVPREHWRNYPSQWQDHEYLESNGTSTTLHVNFRRTPRWTNVRGTRVMMIRQGVRPDYDMFRYGRNYYVYDNHRWYMSRHWRGRFNMIDERSVPRELAMVPRENWRNYPSAWLDSNGNRRHGGNGYRR